MAPAFQKPGTSTSRMINAILIRIWIIGRYILQMLLGILFDLSSKQSLLSILSIPPLCVAVVSVARLHKAVATGYLFPAMSRTVRAYTFGSANPILCFEIQLYGMVEYKMVL